ncbi:hypothetical protein F7725_014468 [Dissostichus mawsoni]|uniref:PDZ domain-containing protein n=1 Tax=Dissostichus mawsoni TaxID=36200 RepID=A0A7J5YWD5_DISMA|nr:hypothetical protein F7725_014468 [Dissostichus mawsoni]
MTEPEDISMTDIGLQPTSHQPATLDNGMEESGPRIAYTTTPSVIVTSISSPAILHSPTAPDPPTPHQHHPRVFVLRAGSRQEDKPGLTEKKLPPRPTGTKGYQWKTGTQHQEEKTHSKQELLAGGMSSYTVTLNGPAPWGFRLHGGKDFNMPLTISRITPGSKAVGGSLAQGDIISAIDGVTTEGMTHMDAQNKIKSASNTLALTMQKSRRAAAFSTPRMDSPMPDLEVGPTHFGEEVQMLQVGKKDPDLLSTPVKTSASSSPSALSPPGQYNSPVGLYSAETLREMMMMQGNLGQGSTASLGVSSLLEYTPSFNPIALKDSALSTHKPIEVRGPGGKATIVHAQYNTPISMYSQDAIMDAIAGQSQAKGHDSEEVGSPLSGSLPIKDPVVDCASPVYQAVIRPLGDTNDSMSEWARRAANLQSKSFRMLAHITGTEYLQDPDEEALAKSRSPLCQAEELAPRTVFTDPQRPGIKRRKKKRRTCKGRNGQKHRSKKEKGISYGRIKKGTGGGGNSSGILF